MSVRRQGPAEAPNLGEPSVPRPAASVVLLRAGGGHGDRGLEALMLKRTESARFMPGVWVFPGGGLDPPEAEVAGHEACARRELREESAVELPADAELVLFSRWITPEVISRRFDAWFFLAQAPAHSRPRPDGVETVEARWFEPRQALDEHRDERLPLAFPTVSQLRALSEFSSPEEAIAAFRGRPVEAILPKVIGTLEEHRVVLPGDPDYPA